MRGDRFGTHRVVEPKGVLPQAALKLDNDMSRFYDEEILIDVETLNIDSASFRQMEEERGSGAGVAALVQSTVRERGKQHNRVTGSGGMLVGRVARIGDAADCAKEAMITVGDRVATLVSLTLTPLVIDRVRAVHSSRHQIDIDGRAIVFASGSIVKLPSGKGALDERVALAALDVAGAAPQVARLVERGARVLILGCGGKSGLLVAAAAKRAGAKTIVGVERSESAASGARRLAACDHIVIADATDAVNVARETVARAGGEFDLTVSCVNVADAEMTAILATRNRGKIYFFSMATSFTKAALGAEGVSRDVELLIGNGYCRDHAAQTLALLDENRLLREIFEERFKD